MALLSLLWQELHLHEIKVGLWELALIALLSPPIFAPDKQAAAICLALLWWHCNFSLPKVPRVSP